MKVLHHRLPATWKKGCTSKFRHDTRQAAEQALVLMQAKEPKKIFNIYRCKNCGYLHVGSTGEAPYARKIKS